MNPNDPLLLRLLPGVFTPQELTLLWTLPEFQQAVEAANRENPFFMHAIIETAFHLLGHG